MKRNMDLIRDILLYVEENAGQKAGKLCIPSFPEYENDFVDYHIRLCHEAGYIVASFPAQDRPHIANLTWDGHEALERMR